MGLSEAVQLIEPERTVAKAFVEDLEEELESTWRVHLDDPGWVGTRVPHGVGDAPRLEHPAARRAPDHILRHTYMRLSLECVEPHIVLREHVAAGAIPDRTVAR